MKNLFVWRYLNRIFEKRVWIKENIYMIKIMRKYYSNYQKKIISHAFFDYIKNDVKFGIFCNHINRINVDSIYNSQVHGMKHIINVTFFSYLIGCNEKLSIDDMDILLDSALYHDIGRNSDNEDIEHGYRGATKIMRLTKNNKIIPAIIHAHSLLDNEADCIFEQYHIEKSQYDRYIKLLSILKDADALDRFRLRPNSLKPEYFRIDYSKELISLACVLSKVVYCY